MARFLAAAASVGAVAVSLSGCGAGGTTTQAPPTHGPNNGTTTSKPNAPTTTTPDSRTPLYLVMRMDDTNPVQDDDVQTNILNWFADHNLKYNFGVIVGATPGVQFGVYWPLTCKEKPSDLYCDSKTVQFVQNAYDTGKVVGTGDDAIFEIGSHAWDHETWGTKWKGNVPDSDWAEWQEHDLENSTTALRQLYPQASIKYFAAPTNMASAETLVSMKNHGLEIISAAGTYGCGSWTDPPTPFYLTSPCGVQRHPEADPLPVPTAECEPEGDVWATTEGFARVQDIISAPAGCANSNWAGGGQQGITVDETIGVNDCGCNTETSGANTKIWCSLVSSAKNNAAKSNGLHWTVMMMHPSSVFPGNQSYTEWLDEFYEKVQALEDYSVHFINFQDLAGLHAPGAVTETVALV